MDPNENQQEGQDAMNARYDYLREAFGGERFDPANEYGGEWEYEDGAA